MAFGSPTDFQQGAPSSTLSDRSHRPETCCSANCSTARETAFPGNVYSAGQVRDLAWTRPCTCGAPSAAAALGCECGFPSVACDAPLTTFAQQHVSGHGD